MLVVADAGGEIRRGVCGTSAGSSDTWRTTEGRGHSHILIYNSCVTYWCISNVPRRQSHRCSGLATLPSVGAIGWLSNGTSFN